MADYPSPVGATARRVAWSFLPPPVRAEIERRLGSPVVDAASQDSGFTPGFASVLTCADGTRHFVKAAATVAQRVFAESYREEARKLGALPAGVPAPRLLWTAEIGGWVVLETEHVAARAPRRPWTADDLGRSLAMLATVRDVLTPPPPGLGLDTFAAELATVPAMWGSVLARGPREHGAEAAALAAGFAEVTAGSTLVHTDVRDDNILVVTEGSPGRSTGDVLLCDWNWPVVGAAWLDSLICLIDPRGDGLDVESVLATHPTFADVERDAVDVVLALLAGYFLGSAAQPVPPTSPHLRGHQRWQGDVCWEWLCERRGWV